MRRSPWQAFQYRLGSAQNSATPAHEQASRALDVLEKVFLQLEKGNDLQQHIAPINQPEPAIFGHFAPSLVEAPIYQQGISP